MRRASLVLFALLAFAGLITSCGDDDDDGEEAAGGADAAAFCDGFLALNEGEPTPDGIRAVGEDAPDDETKAAFDAIADGVEEEGEAFFESDGFTENFAVVTGAAVEECADTEIDVTAKEYAFEGLPDEVDAGILGINFENTGGEVHEIVLFAKGPDAGDATFDELLELGEEEAEGKLISKGGSFAPPGETNAGIFDVTEPGDYVAVCFIPEGTTGEEEGEGPPHFTKGMKVEFTVS